MLLQTNSYIVPKDKRTEHARLIMRFKQTLARLGCDHFEAYEQVGANWSAAEATGRFVQIMRFRDKKHQQQVQAAERNDMAAQTLIKEFCELINFPYQQQQGLFAVGFYSSVLPNTIARIPPPARVETLAPPPQVQAQPHPEADRRPPEAAPAPEEAATARTVEEPLPPGLDDTATDLAPPDFSDESTQHEAGDTELEINLEEFEPPLNDEDDTTSPDRAMRR